MHPEQGELPLEGGNRLVEGGKQSLQGGKRVLPDLPPEPAARLPQPRQRLGEAALHVLIRDLCGWQALRGEELATLLHKDLKYLRNKHLTDMVQTGELAFLFPESPNHALHGLQVACEKTRSVTVMAIFLDLLAKKMEQQREPSRKMAFYAPTRAFAEAWPDAEIVQQAVGQLPWGHNRLLDCHKLGRWL